jgi:hypothetical protein
LYTFQLEGIPEGRDHVLNWVLYYHRICMKVLKEIKVKMATVPDEIRTEHLQNMSMTRGEVIPLDSVRICTKHDG